MKGCGRSLVQRSLNRDQKKVITCLVQNKDGYSNLCASADQTAYGTRVLRLVDDVAPLSGGLLVLCRDISLLAEI